MACAEVLSVGTELLLGQILDTNAQFLAQELARLGIDCYFRTTVGDNKVRIKDALRLALSRADIVITTGGLGPTPDDLTTECIAELFDTPLVLDQVVLERIEQLFALRNYRMPESNRKQALRPLGADLLPNPVGTAPGIIWCLSARETAKLALSGERFILTFPGVPSEMRVMWLETAVTFLRERFESGVLWSIELKHYGIGESKLAEQYSHLLSLASPTVAPYAGLGECRLRITAKANSVEEAKRISQPVIDEVVRGSGHRLYGTDDESLESVVGKLLTKQEKVLAVAESCTGGLVSERLTNVAGSSRYIHLNAVTYSNSAKTQLLGVDPGLLERYGAVSAECAESMARGIRTVANADLGLSITGIAGPDGGGPDKPVGLVYLGLAAKDFYCGKRLDLPPTLARTDIRYRTASEALNMVRLYLLDPSILLVLTAAKECN